MALDSYLDAPEVRRLVCSKARRMIGRAGFTKCDQSDIEQELWLKLLRAANQYRPAKGAFPAFAQTVVDRYAKSLLAARVASKRRAHHTVSVNVNVQLGDGESVELAEQLTVSDARRHRGMDVDDELAAAERSIDVHDALDRMTEQVRAVAEALQYTSITEAARRAGVPRTTLYWQLQKICTQFEDAGLREYLR